MKQLHNIVAPLVLFCLLAAGFPVFAQEQGKKRLSEDAG